MTSEETAPNAGAAVYKNTNRPRTMRRLISKRNCRNFEFDAIEGVEPAVTASHRTTFQTLTDSVAYCDAGGAVL